MGKVINLKAKANPIVETLEELLAAAKNGEFVGLAYAVAKNGGGLNTGWDGEGDAVCVLGAAVLVLQKQYADMISACGADE